MQNGNLQLYGLSGYGTVRDFEPVLIVNNSSYDNFVCYCSKNLESFVISEDGRLIMSTRDWMSLTNDEKKAIKNSNMNLDTSIYYDLLGNYLVQDDFQKLSLIF